MKKGVRRFGLFIFLSGLVHFAFAQDCSFTSPISSFSVDTVCSPVSAGWTVSYAGVVDAGVSVSIRFDWGDGTVNTVAASETDPGTNRWEASDDHIYLSSSGACSYEPTAQLTIDGTVCPLSLLTTQVKVWDSEQVNGGMVVPYPAVHDVCLGDALDIRFTDSTIFNCNPNYETEEPNTDTRWIQWVYGTSSNLTGSAVLVGGAAVTLPFEGNVIKLQGPVSTSGLQSLPISLQGDDLAGEEFEVELRYWNHCNPYEPGPPSTPLSQTAIIRIVEIPDPNITEVAPVCASDAPFSLEATPAGGTWTGPGVDPVSGLFTPLEAGAGIHEIIYQVPVGESCAPSDTIEIEVKANPPVQLTPVGLLSVNENALDLQASPAGGIWSGTGITDAIQGTFDPALAGTGTHTLTYMAAGADCPSYGTMDITVVDPPNAVITTFDSSWCSPVPAQSHIFIEVSGTNTSRFELIVEFQGRRDTLNLSSPRTLDIIVANQAGDNVYRLLKIIEYFGDDPLEVELSDELVLHVDEISNLQMEVSHDGSCSPVQASFTVNEDYQDYSWDFGDGTGSNQTNLDHVFEFSYEDVAVQSGSGFSFLRHDTTYVVWLKVETAGGCKDSAQYHMLVHPSPEASFSVSEDSLTFPDSTLQLTNLTSIGDWDFQWEFGDSNTSSQENPLSHVYSLWGSFEVILRASTDYCADTFRRVIHRFPPPPVAAFETDLNGCVPFKTSFQNLSIHADGFKWSFGDGDISTDSNPAHEFEEVGSYIIKLVASGPSGKDSLEKVLTVSPKPDLDFSVDPSYSENLLYEFQFKNLSEGGQYYLWDFGDGTTSANPDPVHSYGEAGSYNVTLIGGTEYDCIDTLVMDNLIRVVVGEGSVQFPTAFKWTGGGPGGGDWQHKPEDNSIFHPTVINVSEVHLLIYSRWGDKLFETNDLYVGWDGFLKDGKLAEEGVYVYKALVKFVDGTSGTYTGDVTFLHAF